MALRLTRAVNLRRATLYTGSRKTHSVRRDRKPTTENDAGLVDPNLSMWRSINAEHKEVEQVPTDQTENILNYYKGRWMREQKDEKPEAVEHTTGAPKTDDKKSLYSQLARRNATKGQSEVRMAGNQVQLTAYDQYHMQKMPPVSQQEMEFQGRSFGHIRQAEAAPGFWGSDNAQQPYGNSISAEAHFGANSSAMNKEHAPPPNGPYRQSFSMADFIGNPAPAKPTDNQGSSKEEKFEGKSSSTNPNL
ncbi:Hypothetical protein NTJ_07648 [Nesidiocoris tenuis]|uniref:Uncharacterized protein n=1 Tax=Nesidiocoris tenuis TaxID=355587 RepID=A0ABN7ASB8_9HEMI|nr:Hypothetical protein NTJ_07648 [Nesidiocoris tenuis]